ncbi:hypothetical protein ACNFG0_08245 [Pseudomonas sp. NY15372]|uniref:hypothetical protein n=1 Tax=Pseudomonas sp. NY15372 TaxID=3400356 RepID=UPI003A85EB98
MTNNISEVLDDLTGEPASLRWSDLTALDLEPRHLQRKGAYLTAAARAFIEVAMQVATALQEA